MLRFPATQAARPNRCSAARLTHAAHAVGCGVATHATPPIPVRAKRKQEIPPIPVRAKREWEMGGLA